MSGFLTELRQRNVLRVGSAYVVGSWLILQSVEVVFPILGLDESLGRPILYLLLGGLPVVLILAWVFEITPQGIKRDRDVSEADRLDRDGRRRIDRIIIVVLIIAVALLLVDRFALTKSAPSQPLAAVVAPPSIAVLPFRNSGADADDDYFSDGLTETLLHMLAQVPELRVAARTSVFAFKDQELDAREIAGRLGVANILEGSVQRAGETVRIRAQLIEAETGLALWSQSFERDLDDIFQVQDEIANNVARALKVTLLGSVIRDAGLSTSSTDAYEKYLQGLEQKNIAAYSTLPVAEGLFKEALSIDPEFVEAKIELARSYQLQAETGLIDAATATSRIRPLIEQVLDAEPENGRALGMLATIDWAQALLTFGPAAPQTGGAADALRRAIAFAPNDPDIYSALSTAASAANRNDEALEWVDKGLERDPLSARLHLQRGRLLLGPLDRPTDAERAFARGREVAPAWTALTFASGDAAFAQDDFADGVFWYLEAMRLDPQDHELPSSIARFYYQLGMTAEGDEMFRRAEALAPDATWTRGLELERQLRAGNHERAVIAAQSIIRDNLDDRGGAFSLAVAGYVSSMIELGEAGKVGEFFESLRPGITNPGYIPTGIKDVLIQFVIVHALNDAGSVERAADLLERTVSFGDRVAPGWRDDAYIQATIAIAEGDTGRAVERALADLDNPLGRNMNWRMNYRIFAWFRPLLDSSKLAARLAELDEETERAATAVRIMLAAGEN